MYNLGFSRYGVIIMVDAIKDPVYRCESSNQNGTAAQSLVQSDIEIKIRMCICVVLVHLELCVDVSLLSVDVCLKSFSLSIPASVDEFTNKVRARRIKVIC